MKNSKITAEIRLYLTEHFDYISKMGAIRRIKEVFGNIASLAIIMEAYKSIDKFND